MLEHLLGHHEVGNDAVLQRTDGRDIAGRAPKHTLGFAAHRRDLLLAVGCAYRHNGGLIQNDATAAYKNKGVGGSKIDGKIAGKDASQFLDEHQCRFNLAVRVQSLESGTKCGMAREKR